MKTNLSYIVSALALSFAVSSCTKKFEPSSYAPALNIGGYSSSKQVASANLIAQWSFDDSTIDSVSKTVGTPTGTSFSAGVKGKALQVAANGYVVSNTPTDVQNLKSFTTMLWFKSDLNTVATGLIDIANSAAGWGNLTIFLENGGDATKGLIKFHINSNSKEAWSEVYTVPSPWKKWNHLALSYNQATSDFTLYLNGSKIGNALNVPNYGPITFQNAAKMVFGTLQFQTTPSLSTTAGKESWAGSIIGQLDEVKIFNKALTVDEISSITKLEGRGK
jgi:hypothetical protein